eukprot:TRINITY_DN9330_c1_g1_i1.p1 TRINITY_DN9330_c1_g1~~TRINITY_DN9330_c1_g1_i1.p1  ORF type:complete len:229 (-),score=53.92 TRINITY_DN9330_c1_g1_i1:768-1454(-)
MALPSTLMLKNLPSRWSSEGVLEVIHEAGFEKSYDWFYMPRRSQSVKSLALGYAFINFEDVSAARDFCAAAESGLLTFGNRVASVVPANIQGRENLDVHFHSKHVARIRRSREVSVPEGGRCNAPVALQKASSTARTASSFMVKDEVPEVKRLIWADVIDDEPFDVQNWACGAACGRSSKKKEEACAMAASVAVPGSGADKVTEKPKASSPSSKWADMFDEEEEMEEW